MFRVRRCEEIYQRNLKYVHEVISSFVMQAKACIQHFINFSGCHLAQKTRRSHDKLLFFLLLLLSGIAHALPEDNKEKLFIVADSSTYNYKTGINTFIGHVKVDQGTTHVLADKLITKSDARHKIQEEIAYGNRETAHYWTIPKKGDPEVHAYAMIIKFYPVQSNVVLEKNVVVTQAENSFKGQVILYNRTDQTITVPASNEGHAVLVYNPNS